MRLISFGEYRKEHFGVLTPDQKTILDLHQIDSEIPDDIIAFLENPQWAKIESLLTDYPSLPSQYLIDASSVRRGAPIPAPRLIIGVGLNYQKHAKEGGRKAPDKPKLFSKSPHCVIGHLDPIPYPMQVTKLDYEVELAVVIAKKTQKVKASDAYHFIAGYCVFNDVTARCAQSSDEQFFRGKSMDGFAPMGPYMITINELQDPMNLKLWTKVNGEIRQNDSTSNMIFTIPYLIEYISQNMTLMPGDIIATGTPEGVGIFRSPPALLQKNDIVELSVENLGVIKNTIT